MEELTRIRNERGWTQQQLSDESGVNKATINQIERGKRSPNVETLTRLAHALGVGVADFFPKAQASLWSGEALERRPSILARVVGAAADRWKADMAKQELSDAEISGRVEAALDLYELVTRRVNLEDLEDLPRNEMEELVSVTDKLAIATADGILRLHKSGYLDEQQEERIRQRREKAREWTRQISA
ncbi:MAG: hypothetical protein CYG60_15455 [Actinobacteria bacterium]|nr:MAG: hypothetical protein CYG60_15455 [Actinomycetota bacterium]